MKKVPYIFSLPECDIAYALDNDLGLDWIPRTLGEFYGWCQVVKPAIDNLLDKGFLYRTRFDFPDQFESGELPAFFINTEKVHFDSKIARYIGEV